MTLVPDERPLRLTQSPWREDLLVRAFRGTERLSGLFQFHLELLSTQPELSFASLLGQPLGLELALPDGTCRYFHGHVRRLHQSGISAEGLAIYQLELVPWLWKLGLSTDCRIWSPMVTPDQVYHDQNTQAILTRLFDVFQFTDFEFRGLTAGQEPREFCVQYRETALQFVLRLLEEEGIFFYFEHFAGRHVLVLADNSPQQPACPGQSRARYERGSSLAFKEEDVIVEARWGQELQAGKVAFRDFDFKNPADSLDVTLASEREFEHFEFPGDYTSRSRGDALARIRLEEQTARVGRLEGTSTCRAFCPGFRFKMEDFHRSDVEADQLILSVQHEARQALTGFSGQALTGFSGQDLEAFKYQNQFVSQPLSVPFRPPRDTPRPVVSGTQTAVVTGKAGEELWTDEFGRIKVQFHWDRYGRRDEHSSCWIRVAHHWAGKQYGTFFLPRLGQEVIVDFLEGDPDRPLVVGRVYNAEQQTPYRLPADQTRSTLKSNSSKGGNGSNELRFEDKAGEEEVYIHAQKDFNEVVENNHTTTVHANQTNSVDGEHTESVGGNQTLTVSLNRTLTIKGSQNVTIEGTKPSGGVSGGSVNVTGDYKVDASNTIEIQAPAHIKLTCGGSSILIEPGKITLTAGGGSSIVLDANALVSSSQGSTALLDANATITSSGASQALLDANATLSSSGGSSVLLDANANMSSSGGSSVVLDTNATVTGVAKAIVTAPLSTVSGDAKAELVGGAGSVTADPGGVSVTGPMVKLN